MRVTSGGNLLPNFFMLVAAQADAPLLSNVYPTGTHPFEYTNTFSFTVTSFGQQLSGERHPRELSMAMTSPRTW